MPRQPRQEVQFKTVGDGNLPWEMLSYLGEGHDFFGVFTTPTDEMKNPAELKSHYFTHKAELLAFAKKEHGKGAKPYAYFRFEKGEDHYEAWRSTHYADEPSAFHAGHKFYRSELDLPPYARHPHYVLTFDDDTEAVMEPAQAKEFAAWLFSEKNCELEGDTAEEIKAGAGYDPGHIIPGRKGAQWRDGVR
jgi:hypothetical protein